MFVPKKKSQYSKPAYKKFTSSDQTVQFLIKRINFEKRLMIFLYEAITVKTILSYGAYSFRTLQGGLIKEGDY